MPRGRPRVPIEVQKQRGNRLSQKQIAERTTTPVECNDTNIVMPPEFKNNKIAKAKWDYLVSELRKTDCVRSIDADVIKSLCELHVDMIKYRNDYNTEGIPYDTQMKIHKHILNIRDMMLKNEDRLFMNPVSRKRGLPDQPAPPPKSRAEEFGFGDV